MARDVESGQSEVETDLTAERSEWSLILKPAVESGNVPSPWNADLVALLSATVRLFAAGGAGLGMRVK